MAKKRFNLYVDEDVWEGLRKKVKERGMAFSPYIETLMRENLVILTEFKDVNTLGDITVEQLWKLLNKSMEDMQHASKSKK